MDNTQIEAVQSLDECILEPQTQTVHSHAIEIITCLSYCTEIRQDDCTARKKKVKQRLTKKLEELGITDLYADWQTYRLHPQDTQPSAKYFAHRNGNGLNLCWQDRKLIHKIFLAGEEEIIAYSSGEKQLPAKLTPNEYNIRTTIFGTK